jgi:poly-gamma-glutamate capsule biosynthesis protein CapA/YwtB (metallophosphatase superfamily)
MKLKVKASDKDNNIPSLKYNSNNLGKEFKILFVGDISFAENYVLHDSSESKSGINVIEQYGRDYFFENIKHALFDADLVIANLETPLVDIKNTQRPYFSYSSRYNKKEGRFQHWSDSKKTPIYLKKYNISTVCLANNHMLDFGIEGLYQTLDTLDNYRIKFFGAGYNRKQARTPFIKEIVVGKKIVKLIVFSAFEYRKAYDIDFSFYASSSKGGVNQLSLTAITKKIKEIRENTDDTFIVIFPHLSGARNYGWKTDRQTEMGHKLIDAGANLVIGHGPHNLQQIEKYKDHWIVYSLGNFVFNSRGAYDKYNAPPHGLVAKLIFSDRQNNNIMQDISNNPITKYMRLYVTVIDNKRTNFQTRFVNEKEFEFVYKSLISNKDIWKPSEDETKTGIDNIGRYIELSLD